MPTGRIPLQRLTGWLCRLQQDRRVYRLLRHGLFVAEYKTPDELAKVIDLADAGRGGRKGGQIVGRLGMVPA